MMKKRPSPSAEEEIGNVPCSCQKNEDDSLIILPQATAEASSREGIGGGQQTDEEGIGDGSHRLMMMDDEDAIHHKAFFRRLPNGVILHVLSFLDAEGLTNCAQVSLDLYEASDYPKLWEAAALHAYPNAPDLGDIFTYNGEWKTLLLERNRRNRSMLHEWVLVDCIGNTARRCSPVFVVEGYSFQLIVDPSGNPYVPLAKPGVSVYICCCPTAQVLGFDADGRMLMPPQESQQSWECCVAFAISVCNQQGLKRHLTWSSNLANDRFGPECREWGVHRLISLRRLRDPANGYLGPNNQLKLQVRLRFLHYKIKVFTTQVLRNHEGFGIADLTNPSLTSSPSTALIRTYEFFQCMSISAFRAHVAEDLGLKCPHQLRLWVQTQPWADCPSTPRDLLKAVGIPPDLAVGQNVPESPTLAHVLQAHQDGISEARVFAEVSGDGGLMEEEDVRQTMMMMKTVYQHEGGGEGAVEDQIKEDVLVSAGGEGSAKGDPLFSLSEVVAAARGEGRGAGAAKQGGEARGRRRKKALVPTMAGQSLPTNITMLPEPIDPAVQELAEAGQAIPPAVPPVPPPPQPPAAPVVAVQQQQPPLVAAANDPQQDQQAVGAGGGEATAAGEQAVEEEEANPNYVLLFLKWFGDERPSLSSSSSSSSSSSYSSFSSSRLRFFTHVVVKANSSPRSIFESVGARVGLPPDHLRVYIEAPPTCWQPSPLPLPTSDPPHIARFICLDWPQEESATYRKMEIQNGQILCFFQAGRENALKAKYMSMIEDLLCDAGAMYLHTGNKALVTTPSTRLCPSRPLHSRLRPRLKFEEVVDLFERLGNQRFRIRNTAYEKKHRSARETFEYAIAGRHLGFCCDRCGETDFIGPRHKCTICEDYDLCPKCHELPIELHRFRFDRRQWTKEDFSAHQADHPMDVVLPIPQSMELLLRYV